MTGDEADGMGIKWPPVHDDGDPLEALTGTPAPVVESEEDGLLITTCACGRRFEGTDRFAVAALLGVHRCKPRGAEFP